MTPPAAPRRALVLVDQYVDPYGGTEGQIHALLGDLPPAWSAEMWVLQPSRWVVEHPFPVPVRNLGLRGLVRPGSLLRLVALARQVRRRSFDVIHTYMNDASVVGPLLGALASVPVHVSRRDLGFWQTPRFLRALRRTGRLARSVVANCEAVARHTVTTEHAPRAIVDVVRNGHDPRRFDVPPAAGLRERLGIPPDAPLVGLLANVKPLKRHDDLLDAMSRLREGHPALHAICIGDHVEGDVPLVERARRRGLEGCVHVVSAPGDAVPLLRHLDVGVLCSETEGLSNAVLEYMGCGLPVVATGVGGTPELVSDGETGLLYAPGDVEGLAGALDRLLGDPERAREMGAAGERRLRSAFTLDRMVRETTALWARTRTAARPAPDADLDWEVVEDVGALESLAGPWAELLAADRFFAGPDWVLAYLAWRGDAARPHVLVARDRDGALAGVLPLVRASRGVLAFPGEGLGADHLDVVARPERAAAVARGALALLEGRPWRRLRWHHLAEDAALRAALRERGWALPYAERLATRCPYVEAEGTYEDYVAHHFSYASRRNVRRYPRRFRGLEGATVERVKGPDEAARAIDRFFALHAARFAERGVASALAGAGLRDFHRRLAERAARAGRLAMTFLRLGARDVACEYGFRLADKLYAFQSGFDDDVPFESPGVVLQAIVLEEDVFGAGLREYDFLDGQEDYKRRWATGERRLFDVEVHRPTLLGRAGCLARGAARWAYETITDSPA